MLFNVKMRASADTGRHISGAERLVTADQLEETLCDLNYRAFHHDNGHPTDVHFSLHAVDDTSISHCEALPRRVIPTATVAAARTAVTELLASHGIAHGDALLDQLMALRGMRGAALIDADTLTRRDTLRQRGVRVTALDNDLPPALMKVTSGKPYYYEALTLATKVASHPAIIAELCISDDPHYTTGYVAIGGEYVRVENMKEDGSAAGGRIFVVRGDDDLIADCIDYLQNQPVIVHNIPPVTPTPPATIDEFARHEMDLWDKAGLSRTPPVFSAHGQASSVINGTQMLNFASSDYLGLSHHSQVKAAHLAAWDSFGTTSTGSRLTTGNTQFHLGAEHAAAHLTGYGDAVLFATGYQANLSTIQALAVGLPDYPGPALTIFSDADNHASLIDGIRLAARSPKVHVEVYKHCDMNDLEHKLSRCSSPRKLIVSDGVFSMGGDICPLPTLIDLATRFGAWTMIDDAHGVGTIGPTGRGTLEYYDPTCQIRPDILTVTASKALGGEGALICTSTPVATLLRNRARGYVFSTAISPSAAAGIEAALKLVAQNAAGTARLKDLSEAMRHGLHTAGFPVSLAHTTPIIPIPLGDENLATAVSAAMAREGFWVPAIRYPTVPRGQAILRVTVTAAHQPADIRRFVDTLRAVVDQLS